MTRIRSVTESQAASDLTSGWFDAIEITTICTQLKRRFCFNLLIHILKRFSDPYIYCHEKWGSLLFWVFF